MSEEELIRGCLKHERNCQRVLFEMYAVAMTDVCIRYAKNQQETKEILLSGFKNIFSGFKNIAEENTKRKKDSPSVTLGEWIKKEMVLSAVRHMHHNKREYFVSSTVSMRDAEKSSSEEISDEKIMQFASKQAIIKALQQLTPSYRAVYNMHEVDGYNHAEISKLLDISEYSSKDSLSKAKFNLRRNLTRMIPK
ncbi:MAG: sigma-70 family RNA polymerase sigma factor [Bacteroidetes bacterium]|nr:sigma-70 family RNA polymerase sigma factor [Bacteroidota bacterium]